MEQYKTTSVELNGIVLNEHFTNKVINRKLIEKCTGEVLSKMKELKYNSSACYSIAAIALFLDTLSRDEREEILDVLNLKENINN